MKNLEIKLRVDDFRDILYKINKNNFGDKKVLRQIDVYYLLNPKKIKTREINGEEFQLISYNRPRIKDSKFSDYRILNFNKQEFNMIEDVLDLTLGRKVQIDKKRQLWVYKNTRIHLDTVSELGKFVELETVISCLELKKAEEQHQDVINLLGLGKYPKCRESYGEMVDKFENLTVNRTYL